MPASHTRYQGPHAAAAKFVLSALVLAIILHFPNLHRDLNIGVPFHGFPLDFITNGMNMMATFFHEIGHAASGWLFGYPTIPVFDVKHGGGMAWHTDQHWFIILCVYLGFGWLATKIWGHMGLVAGLGILAAVHAALLMTDGHVVWILIMGHGFELGFGVIFLIRCLYDLAPRGAVERALNGIIGFYLVFNVMIVCWGIMNDPAYRMVYRAQKGAEDFGDLSRIAIDHFQTTLDTVAGTLMGASFVALLVPFVLYLVYPPLGAEES